MLKVASSLRNIRETGYVFISQERLGMMLLLRLRHRKNETEDKCPGDSLSLDTTLQQGKM